MILSSSKILKDGLEPQRDQRSSKIHREYLEILRGWKAKKKARMLRGYSELNNQKKLSKKKGFRRLPAQAHVGEIMAKAFKKFSAVCDK